ncbi:uncharacterized protein LOC132745635 [Ruditapes philippinarum]|uniref:uncharacterized protein LOC132745635 n=1 Tax=Ruditapes philippinarum TaxID=129788 RepID=UPI00295BCE1D|nr:uncharacterized protein LOC132745635 [Ruditapes philippinarum]
MFSTDQKLNLSKFDGERKMEAKEYCYLEQQDQVEPSSSQDMNKAGVRKYARDVGTHSKDIKTDRRDSQALKREVDTIRLSLDVLKDTLIMQQYVLARDFEARIRNVYDDVINDLNGIRKRVNDIGDTFESETKFKTWTPLMPIRKDVLPSAMSSKSTSKNKLKGSKSVDFVDKRGTDDDYNSSEIDFDKFESKKIFSQRQSWLGSSQGSINSTGSSRKLVPGFGGCFDGDGKTIPYRSYRARHNSNRTNRHSWGPSRSVSRSTLDDDDFEDKGCLCGDVAEDWRVKVAPYMWEGWAVPGINNVDIHKLRERMEHLEKMRHEIVHVHNEYRHQHGCPELSVTTELAREAQQWADLLAMRGFAQYKDSQGRGENILVVDIEDNLSGRQVVDTWYREGRGYNYHRPAWKKETSNFTQMIWKSSKFVGVGIAKFPLDNTYVIVVQYQPQGNINTPAHFRRNVPSATAKKTPVFESNVPLQNASNKPKGKSGTTVQEPKLSHQLPPDDVSSVKQESSLDTVEIKEHLVKTEVKLYNAIAMNNSDIANNIQTKSTDGLDKLVAGLDIVIQNLTRRRRSGCNDCVTEKNDNAENKGDEGNNALEDIDTDGIEEQIDVNDDCIVEHDIEDNEDILKRDDKGNEGILEHDDVDGDACNDEDDLIASVSASLASSVYDGSLADENSIKVGAKQQDRVIHKYDQEQISGWTSGNSVSRQSSRERKVTSV